MGRRSGYVLVDENDPGWMRFWDAYPKRVAKKEARKAWAQINPTPAQVDAMVEALAWQREEPSWQKDGRQFVPFPASWLRAMRWTDERPTSAAPLSDKNRTTLEAARAFIRGDAA